MFHIWNMRPLLVSYAEHINGLILDKNNHMSLQLASGYPINADTLRNLTQIRML